MKKLFTFALLVLVVASCQKQPEQKTACESIPYNDAATKSRMEEMERGIQADITENAARRSMATPPVLIPVVFHVVYNQAVQNISDAQLQSQIDVLNEDFNSANADISSVPAAFKPYTGNTNIRFALAKQDPNGKATNGITRTSTAVTSFSSDGRVCFTSMGGHDAWPTDQYLNIWVCYKTGAAGYSSYPWSGNPSSDGIIVSCNYVGRTGTFTNNWNYKKGRTITHEVGHWLGLVHLWGDAVCGSDLVNDTPIQRSANGSSPVFPHLSGCTTDSKGDMFMNYMDYTYDATRVMFSAGQAVRMNSYLNTVRSRIKTSLGGVAPSL